MKKLCITFFISLFAMHFTHPAAKTAPAASAAPALAKASASKIASAPTSTPKAPASKIITPVPTAATLQTKIITPVPTKVTTKQTSDANSQGLPVPVNIINTNKTSTASSNLEKVTFVYKTTKKSSYTYSLQSGKSKNYNVPTSITLTIKFPPQSFYMGVSSIVIEGQQIKTLYKKQPWNTTLTDAIYVTNKTGRWKLDHAAMDTAYKTPTSIGSKTASKTFAPISTTTATTKDVATALINSKKSKKSKSSITAKKNITTTNQPTLA